MNTEKRTVVTKMDKKDNNNEDEDNRDNDDQTKSCQSEKRPKIKFSLQARRTLSLQSAFVNAIVKHSIDDKNSKDKNDEHNIKFDEKQDNSNVYKRKRKSSSSATKAKRFKPTSSESPLPPTISEVTSASDYQSNTAKDFLISKMQDLITSNIPFIDSHCHIDLISKRDKTFTNYGEFMIQNKDLFPKNYLGCVAVFCYPKDWSNDHFKESFMDPLLSMSRVWATVGCHPKDASSFNEIAKMKLMMMLTNPKIVAVGEMGLDYSQEFFRNQRDLQMKVFAEQLEIASIKNIPIVIHSREAEEDTIEVLLQLKCKDAKIHRHCFTGSWEQAKKWLQIFPNSYIGLTPTVTYIHKNPNLHEVMKNVPLDKLLIETDSPYFVPKMMSSEIMKISHPGMAITVAIEIAKAKGCNLDNVLGAVLKNTLQMYNIEI